MPVEKSMRKIQGFAKCRQRGAIAIMTAVTLPVIIGLLALAIESARLYNRKAEMQALGDAIALTAAKQLDGSSDGISNAISAAHDVVESGYELTLPRYEYGSTMIFSDSAIKFAKSPDGGTGWLDVDAAKASPAGIAYVKVSTNDLNSAYGTVDLWFAKFLTSDDSIQVSHTSVAGRHRLNIVPFGVCAMSKDPANPIDERQNPNSYSELREYGFRRGVSYNLMKLSPNTATPVSYIFDPISLSASGGSSGADIVGTYMCTGTVELPKVVGETVNVLGNLALGSFVTHLNSRFDLANGPCNPISAPPDSNIRQYPFGTITWMTKPIVQVPDSVTSSSRLETIADLAPPNNQIPTHYGPLWVFARAVPWSSYTSGQSEPAQGYLPYQATSTIWKWLYSTGPTVNTYPKDPKTGSDSPPYFIQTTSPSLHPPGQKYRRVLNVPLLSCPAAGSPGTVVAIGKFFMTVPADANGIYAEFAGTTSSEGIVGPVELYP